MSVCHTMPVLVLGSKLDVSVVSHSKDTPVLSVDDDKLYVVHDKGEGRGEGPEGSAEGEKSANINRFRNRVLRESGGEDDSELSSDEVNGHG